MLAVYSGPLRPYRGTSPEGGRFCIVPVKIGSREKTRIIPDSNSGKPVKKATDKSTRKQCLSGAFYRRTVYFRILPSAEMVTTSFGMSFPLALMALLTAFSRPPQQGTSIRVTVMLLISL